MQIITVILSSAVIASIVSIILNNLFENKRYIKDKKIEIYTSFLEHLNKVFESDKESQLSKINDGIHKLTYQTWRVRLISKNSFIQEQSNNILKTLEEMKEALSQLINYPGKEIDTKSHY